MTTNNEKEEEPRKPHKLRVENDNSLKMKSHHSKHFSLLQETKQDIP